MKMQKRIPSWCGFLGVLGFLGLLPSNVRDDGSHFQYFFFIFFGFFSWFFWAKLMAEPADERLLENQKRATLYMCKFFTLLAFFLLFALSKGVTGDVVLLFGSLAYALGMILSPALVLYFDRVSA